MTDSLKFQLLHPDAVLPVRAHALDAGLDLRTVERVELQPGEQAAVATGLALAIPEGYVGLVFARSGNAFKHGITLANAVGVIDSGYRGELKVLLSHQGHGRGAFTAQVGDRIAQLVIMPVALPVTEAVDALPVAGDERNGGFGSSGRS